MKKWWLKNAAGIAVTLLVTTSVYAPLVAAQAQPPVPEPGQAGNGAAAERTNKLMLTTVVNQMKRDTGVVILLDRSVPTQDVTPLDGSTTVDTLEERLTTLTKSLPKGTVWAKVNLPDRGRAYNGDAVADYVVAQAGLFGGAGAPTPVGTLEVMGQKISGDKAQTVSDALALKPVYVLLNPANRASGASGANGDWSNLTPDQKRQQAQQAAQAILNMTPEQRAGFMQQQMQTMQAMFQGMSPQQRQQMMQTMGGAMRGMGGGGRGRRGQ